jgi:hypothetical protein
MAIDTNLGLVYNQNYPIAGVDQSSQGFRDNFSVLKRAIENLQDASNSASSIFSITSSIGTGGAVRITVGFKDNAFRLPSGNPSVTAEAGMLRHESGNLQSHDGSGWRSVIHTDATGGVRIPGSAFLKLPSGFTDQRPASGEDGMLRFNASVGVVEYYSLGEWRVVGAGDGGSLDAEGGTITGVLNLLTDAKLPDQAVNFRTMKNFATGMFSTRTKGVSASFNQVSNAVLLTAQPFTITLGGDLSGSGIVNNLNDVTIEASITNQLTLADVRDEVGNFVRGTVRVPNANAFTETGITVNYDAVNNTLELGVREFDITLTGAVTGTGHSTKLGNIVIDTASDMIRGVTVFDEDSVLGGEQSVTKLRFRGNGIEATQTGDTAEIVVSAGLSLGDVRDEVGSFVKGTVRNQFGNATTETGILVNYDSVNNTLELGVRDFEIGLTGAVSGSGVISRLGNVVINTTSDRIKGIDAFNEGVALGLPESVNRLNFTGGGVNATQSGNTVTVDVPFGLSLEDVRDHVGTFVTGTVRDPSNLGAFTESGIFVFYDEENNKLELVPRDFNVTITGAVSGATTISRLGNAVINTTTDLIRGIRVFEEGSPLGNPESVHNLDFRGNAISVLQTGNTVSVTVNDGLTTNDVRDVVGSFVRGTARTSNSVTTETGVTVNYDSENLTLEVGVKDFSIGLSGAVTGSAVISKLGNVVIATSTDRIRGIQVKEEGVPTGLAESTKIINFVGNGITATQTGDEVTVEIVSGLSTSDVRDTVGSLVKGTTRTGNSTVTESGITVNYDSSNNTLELGVRDFTIGLNGAVTGSGIISRLGNVSITTTTDLVRGLRFLNEGSATGLAESVREVNFVGSGVNVTQIGNVATVAVNDGLSLSQVRDEVGRIVIGQNGITTVYDSENETVRITPRNFTINLAGDLTGSATVNNLSNVTITAIAPNLIEGLTVQDEGVQQGTAEAIKTIDFTGNGVSIVAVGNKATVNVPQGLTALDVRDTVGSFVSGTQRITEDTVTESGITVNYDATNNTLELGVRPFTIGLTGAVTGSGTVTRLGNVSINTTTDLIKGLRFHNEGSPLGLPETVREVNFVGNAINVTQTGNTAIVSVADGLSAADVRGQVGSMVSGINGINTVFSAENQSLTIAPNNFQIALIGKVSGTGMVNSLGNVTITTTTTAIEGLTVQDEFVALGSAGSVKALNFTGSGIAASRSGDIVTVNVPQGLTSSDVRSTVGSFVTGTQRLGPNTVTESGVTVFFDESNNTLELGVRDFTVGITGAVSGLATISRLGNATIHTTTDLIKGLRLHNEGSPLGLPETVREINFVGNAINVTQTGNSATVTVIDGLSGSDVRTLVGDMVSGTNGITASYNAQNQSLIISPRNFQIALTGQVSGTGMVNSLGNVSITTTTTAIEGISVQDESVTLGSTGSIKTLNFTGSGVAATRSGEIVTVNVPQGLTSTDVRSTVGSFVTGTQRLGPNTVTESGVTVFFDEGNNTLELGVRDFSIGLTGAVSGSAVVSRLGNVSINTTTALIKGMSFHNEGSPLGLPETVREVNFVGNAIHVTQVGNAATVSVSDGLSNRDVRDQVGALLSGINGITTNYNAENQSLTVAPRNFQIALTGQVSGSAMVNSLGNVSIITTTSAIEGLTVQDEGVGLGTVGTVKNFNFTGSGISASRIGNTVTVAVPEGLTNSDVRSTVGTFITGTQRLGPNTVTESGITVFFDQTNNVLEVGARDFTIGLTGAVSGSAVVSRLGNVSITTSTDLVRGLRFYDEGSALGLPETVREVNFVGNGVAVSQTGNTATVTINQDLSLQNVRDEIGAVVQGNNGLTAVYNSGNKSLTLSPRNFNIALVGAVTGNATVTSLGNVSITTSSTAISGMTVQDEGSTLGSVASVTSLNFVGSGVAATRNGAVVTVNVPQGLTSSDVRSTVGTFITGTQRLGPNTVTESGVTIFHDASNNVLEIGVRDFTIGLTGAVNGSAVVSRLGNVSINTTTDLIRGLTVEDEGLTLGTPESVKKLNFVGGGVAVYQNLDILTVEIPTPLGTQDVISTVGSVVQGTIRDPGTNVSSESGIIVNFDSENDVLELSPREFNITLAGAVTGTGKVSRLSNVTINTVSDFIKGLRIQKDGTLLGTTVKTINITGGNATVTGDTATLSLTSQVSQEDIRTTVRSLLVGNHHSGMSAAFDAANSEIDFSLNPLFVNLVGAVTGNASVVHSANSSELTIATTMNGVGIEVRDEGTTSGTVKAVNFVGGGITTAVSIDGEVATVYVPNSPANENFILIDNGSANVPNARKLTAGTGILINDGGPGGAFTISAHNDAIIAKSRFMLEGRLVAERPQINILGSTEIVPEVEDDPDNGQINIRFYGVNDGWYRPNTIDCGLISDKYGPSIDMGALQRGIIESDADMGTI